MAGKRQPGKAISNRDRQGDDKGRLEAARDI
jgi:hypothetical protein